MEWTDLTQWDFLFPEQMGGYPSRWEKTWYKHSTEEPVHAYRYFIYFWGYIEFSEYHDYSGS